MIRRALTLLLAVTLAGCVAEPRSTVEVKEDDARFARAEVPAGQPGAGKQGLRGPGGWLIAPEHAHVFVLSSRCVLTRRTWDEPYERWVVSWSDDEPEVQGPEPTSWRTLSYIPYAKTADELYMVGEDDTGPDYLVLASADQPGESGTLSHQREAVVALLGGDGAPRARYVAELEPQGRGLTWVRPQRFGPSVIAPALDGAARITLIFGLDGRLRLPPLPNLTWVGRHWPVLALDPKLAGGRNDLLWPIDESTGLPVTDPSRSVIGFEPLVADGDLRQGTLFGWLEHHRTPDGPRVGYCSVDRVIDQGPAALRGTFVPDDFRHLLVMERPQGGWTVDWLEYDPELMARRMHPVRRRDAGEPTSEAALAAYRRQAEEESRRWAAEQRAREAEERASNLRVFEALLAAEEPYHPYLEQAARKVGQVRAVQYVRKLRPRNVPFLRWVLEGSLGDEDRAFVAAWLQACLDEQARIAAELAAEQARRQAAWRAEQEERARQLRAAEAAEHERQLHLARMNALFDVSGVTFGDGGDPSAATRRATESLFRHTYGQQDWHWDTGR